MGVRIGFNVVLFGLLLGGIGVFSQHRQPSGEPGTLIGVGVAAALWAGTVVALSEGQSLALPSKRRAGRAALLGALAYIGLFSALSTLAGIGLRPEFIALGGVVGAISHGLRSLRASSLAAAEGDDDDDG
jgi:hypothetical protein